MSNRNEQPDACRKAFEKWHDRIFDVSVEHIRAPHGYPLNSIVQTRWQAWQFAWETARTTMRESGRGTCFNGMHHMFAEGKCVFCSETKPVFGDLIGNQHASKCNPRRKGFFVRSGLRSGKLNPEAYYEVTNGKGDFWEMAAPMAKTEVEDQQP